MGVRAIGIIGLAMFGTADNVFQFERVGGRAWRYGHHTESGEAFQESDLSDGGADYRIEAKDNSGLCRYLKSRCYAVRMDTSLYVNCKKMRYKRYRFGGWYAPAMWVKDRIYFCAQPVGQAAASTATPPDATKLGGEVGDAINASGLVFARVYYELNPETGRSEFVGRRRCWNCWRIIRS